MALDTDSDRPNYNLVYATPLRVHGEWLGAVLRLFIDGVGHDVGVLLSGAEGHHLMAYRQVDTYTRGICVEVRGPGGADGCRRAVLTRLSRVMRDLQAVRDAAHRPEHAP